MWYNSHGISSPFVLCIFHTFIVMDFDVVDADENVVKSWRGIFDVHEEKTCDLPAGQYFIRVKSDYSDGGAYSLKYFLHN